MQILCTTKYKRYTFILHNYHNGKKLYSLFFCLFKVTNLTGRPPWWTNMHWLRLLWKVPGNETSFPPAEKKQVLPKLMRTPMSLSRRFQLIAVSMSFFNSEKTTKKTRQKVSYYIEGFVQHCSVTGAWAMETPQSCVKKPLPDTNYTITPVPVKPHWKIIEIQILSNL